MTRSDNRVPQTSKIALISNYLPRKCGIATFTTDTRNGLIERFPAVDVDVYAMEDLGERRDYPPEVAGVIRSEEHTSELQSLMRISYAVFCLKKNRCKTNTRNKSESLIYTGCHI